MNCEKCEQLKSCTKIAKKNSKAQINCSNFSELVKIANTQKGLGEIKTITLWGNNYRIRRVNVKPEIWDFVDIPFCATFNTKEKGSTYKGSYIESLVLNVIKPELEKALGKKLKNIFIPSKEDLEGKGKLEFYKEDDYSKRIKYICGETYPYWTSSPYTSSNYRAWSVNNVGSLIYYLVVCSIASGVAPAFCL